MNTVNDHSYSHDLFDQSVSQKSSDTNLIFRGSKTNVLHEGVNDCYFSTSSSHAVNLLWFEIVLGAKPIQIVNGIAISVNDLSFCQAQLRRKNFLPNSVVNTPAFRNESRQLYQT